MYPPRLFIVHVNYLRDRLLSKKCIFRPSTEPDEGDRGVDGCDE